MSQVSRLVNESHMELTVASSLISSSATATEMSFRMDKQREFLDDEKTKDDSFWRSNAMN